MCHIRGPGEHDDRAGENQGHGVNAAKLSHVRLKYHTHPFTHKNELSGSCSTATYSGSIHRQWGKEREQSMLCLAWVRQTVLWGAVAFEMGLRNIHVKKILASEFLLLWTKLCFHVFLGVLLSGWWRRLHSLRTHLRANIWDSDHLHPSESAFHRRSVALLQFTLTLLLSRTTHTETRNSPCTGPVRAGTPTRARSTDLRGRVSVLLASRWHYHRAGDYKTFFLPANETLWFGV